jgi:hypothetical protein
MSVSPQNAVNKGYDALPSPLSEVQHRVGQPLASRSFCLRMGWSAVMMMKIQKISVRLIGTCPPLVQSLRVKRKAPGRVSGRRGIEGSCHLPRYHSGESAREAAQTPSGNEPRQRPTLPRRYQRSTIGPGGLNFRVRNGNGCGPSGNATGNRKLAASSAAPNTEILERSQTLLSCPSSDG